MYSVDLICHQNSSYQILDMQNLRFQWYLGTQNCLQFFSIEINEIHAEYCSFLVLIRVHPTVSYANINFPNSSFSVLFVSWSGLWKCLDVVDFKLMTQNNKKYLCMVAEGLKIMES